jgi:glucose-1-phosphate adenylyltransferase
VPRITRWPVKSDFGYSRTPVRNDPCGPAGATHPDVLAIVLAAGAGERLHPLTRRDAKPALPFGGACRLVDITLSNCVNSGLRRICVLTQQKALTLNRHLRDAWNILPSHLGEFIEILPAARPLRGAWCPGSAGAVYRNVPSIEDAQPACVLILPADHVYKMNYLDMLRQHIEEDADVTVATAQAGPDEAGQLGIVEVEGDFEIAGFASKPRDSANGATYHASMGVYLFSTPVLLDALREDAADPDSDHDFGRNVLPGLIGRKRVFAYRFVDQGPRRPRYWRDVGTLDCYYQANMDLLAPAPPFGLYDRDWPIHTAPPRHPPARFLPGEQGDRMSKVLNSLVAPGCVISGSAIANSILSPGVRIHAGSEIEGSVLLTNAVVGRGCRIRRALVDRDARVPANSRIGFDADADRRAGFVITGSGVTVVQSGPPPDGGVLRRAASSLRVLASGARPGVTSA